MSEPLAPELFRSRGTPALARSLLGKLLVRVSPDGAVYRHRIVEVEAYHGGADRACHANRGKTARTSVMFEPGGVWYVYLCYGMHEMLNLVTGPAEFPAAVLIRGVEGISGPGRVTKALAVGRALNGAAAAPASGLYLEDDGLRVPRALIRATPRIGVDYAGPVWAAKPWRFFYDPSELAVRPCRRRARSGSTPA